MDKEERRRLIKALQRADIAFHESLEKDGYSLDRNMLDDLVNGTATIIDNRRSQATFRGVGELTLKWKIWTWR